MYSNFLGSSGNIGYSRAFPAYTIEDNSYRKYPFVTSHLRAYYTQLFRNIKEEDLKDENGDYFRAANDVATCIPILEQSHKRVLYLPELAYLYNSNTGLNNHIVRLSEQKGNDRKIRKKPSYSELTTLMSFQWFCILKFLSSKYNLNLIIFCLNYLRFIPICLCSIIS